MRELAPQGFFPLVGRGAHRALIGQGPLDGRLLAQRGGKGEGALMLRLSLRAHGRRAGLVERGLCLRDFEPNGVLALFRGRARLDERAFRLCRFLAQRLGRSLGSLQFGVHDLAAGRVQRASRLRELAPEGFLALIGRRSRRSRLLAQRGGHGKRPLQLRLHRRRVARAARQIEASLAFHRLQAGGSVFEAPTKGLGLRLRLRLESAGLGGRAVEPGIDLTQLPAQ